MRVEFGARGLRCLLAAGMTLSAASDLASESVTLTTYYPAPSGAYAQMITTGNAWLARDSGDVAIGTSRAAAKLDVEGTGGVILNAGNVGIGTATPASALSVAGGVQVGDDLSICTLAKDGTQRWHAGALQTCTGGLWNTVAPYPNCQTFVFDRPTGTKGNFWYTDSCGNASTVYTKLMSVAGACDMGNCSHFVYETAATTIGPGYVGNYDLTPVYVGSDSGGLSCHTTETACNASKLYLKCCKP